MQQQEVTKPITTLDMYRAGLTIRMSDYAYGPWVQPGQRVAVSSALLAAYAEGLLDADDDSDDPRPTGPALDDPRGAVEPNDLDEDELRAVAASVYQEIDRVGADVSAWPDYGSGRIRVADEVADVAHEPRALLATLRGLPTGAGTDAMWRAVTR